MTEFVAKSGWTLLRGNHEDYVIRQSQKAQSEDMPTITIGCPLGGLPDLTGDFVESIQQLPIATTLQRAGRAFDYHRSRVPKVEQ